MKTITEHKKYTGKLREWLWLILATVSFWGIFYPNFTLTQDVCKIYTQVSEETVDEEEKQQLEEELNGHIDKVKNEGIKISDLKKGKVRVKSRFLNFIKKWWN